MQVIELARFYHAMPTLAGRPSLLLTQRITQ
jgi:hypothetical protein